MSTSASLIRSATDSRFRTQHQLCGRFHELSTSSRCYFRLLLVSIFGHKGDMRILVVEDDAPLATFVQKGLEAEHYAVDTAGNGEQARCMALESDYDLVILDLNLPKLDGLEVLRSIRAKKPSLPVLVLTARNRIEDRVESLDSGADDCLNKPFSFTELSARVRALMRRGSSAVETVL